MHRPQLQPARTKLGLIRHRRQVQQQPKIRSREKLQSRSAFFRVAVCKTLEVYRDVESIAYSISCSGRYRRMAEEATSPSFNRPTSFGDLDYLIDVQLCLRDAGIELLPDTDFTLWPETMCTRLGSILVQKGVFPPSRYFSQRSYPVANDGLARRDSGEDAFCARGETMYDGAEAA
jgi:hypothetical protein